MSNDLAELKQYVAAHAESLGLAPEHYGRILRQIVHDGSGPGSWVYEWAREAVSLEAEGKPLEASQHYNFARFPFVDGPARREALDNCVRTVDAWRQGVPGIERLDFVLPGGKAGAWAIDLSATEPKPLLLISGGIVSLKEQWAPVLLAARQLGLAGLVTEMPGVGENTVPYTAESWRVLRAVLDAVADRVDQHEVYVMAMSFSGQAAFRWAARDSRVRGIVTAGAPVHGPFADGAWRLPKVTADTLARMTGRAATDFTEWALSPAELSTVDVPVYYVASTRDEIIPPGDLALLRAHVRDLHVLEHDDVHGAPAHAAQTREWMVGSLVELRKASGR